MRELKAVMRRANMQEEENRQIKYDDLMIDINYTVTYKGEIVEMPPKEIELLFFLASHPNKVFTREQLLRTYGDFEFFGIRVRWTCTSSACASCTTRGRTGRSKPSGAWVISSRSGRAWGNRCSPGCCPSTY